VLEEMVKSIINKTLETDFPHLVLPAVVYATVTAAKKLPETYEVNELVIYNDETCGSYRGHIVAPWWEYTLEVINRFGNRDEDVPILPGIKSKKQFKAGATVAVAMAYGDLTPSIIGEVEV